MTSHEDIDYFRDDDLVADPYPYFDAAPRTMPCAPGEHHGVVMVTGYEEAVEVFNDTERFSSCTASTGPFAGFPVRLEGDDVAS